jgi:hypothetical protein
VVEDDVRFLRGLDPGDDPDAGLVLLFPASEERRGIADALCILINFPVAAVADEDEIPDLVQPGRLLLEIPAPARAGLREGINVRHLRDVHPLLGDRGLVEQLVTPAKFAASACARPQLALGRAVNAAGEFYVFCHGKFLNRTFSYCTG